MISQAMEQAGIRPSQRHRKVSHYVLEQLISEGPGYQDWQAIHARLPEVRRRVRLYLVRAGTTAEERKTLERAALREFKLLETLAHPGILRVYGFTEHELGPAVIFEHDPHLIRLDHFLAQRKGQLNLDTQFYLVRQIAEVVRYAHEKKVVHRALSPQNILVTQAPANGHRSKSSTGKWAHAVRAGHRHPGALSISDARLLRLAAAASNQAAVSSRQELYPRGMDPSRALKLSQGALLGVRTLTVDQIRERVRSRYPDAGPLPDRPALDELLPGAGLDLQWDPAGKDGSGCYVSRLFDLQAVSSRSESLTRKPTTLGPLGEITPDIADARQFEERLQRAIREGSFLTLLVNPKYYAIAMEDLSRRFPIDLVDCEGVFLDALRDVAEKARVNWDVVLQTDATPNQGELGQADAPGRPRYPGHRAKALDWG